MALVRVDPEHPDPATIARAAELLRGGRLVAFPTETVYGLGANALDADAVARIYAVAVRIPGHPVAHTLLAVAGLPIAAPSANRSTQLSPTTGTHVLQSLGDAVDLILDAGPTPVGIESTVVDLTTPVPALLRPGSITLDELARVVGRVERRASATGDSARPAPGMLDKHYAPRAKVVLVEAPDVGVRVEHARANGLHVGALVVHASVEPAPDIVAMPPDPAGYAAALYASLYALDDAGCDIIVVEKLPETNAWLAVRDRLSRAAH
jgi:L-threonylcarbamoyladenylate synthase